MENVKGKVINFLHNLPQSKSIHVSHHLPRVSRAARGANNNDERGGKKNEIDKEKSEARLAENKSRAEYRSGIYRDL